MSAPTQRVVKKLFALSGNQCAFPNCSTAIVQSESETVTGKICHIKARSPKGLRYDPSQTEDERHGFANLLLLCGVHHDVVDDASRSQEFTVDALTQMKAHHERRGAIELSQDDARRACKLLDTYLQMVAKEEAQIIFGSPGATQKKKKVVRKARVKQTSFGANATLIGGDQHNHYGEKTPRGGRAKPPHDAVTEDQALKLQQMMNEVIELDSATPDGKRLTVKALHAKWWGALYAKVPATTYKNYSQSKFERAKRWLREHRSRLIAGVASDEPALSRAAHIRAIHAYITRNKSNKLSYYSELSSRLGISPPFTSSTDLSDYDLGRVYQATRRDAQQR
jgi:hypothetical protein